MSSTLTSKFSLDVIPRSRVYTEVARQLQERIVDKLKPGDMLPPERQLMRMFGVSRNSIRDAIRTLEAVGLLEPRQGIGTVVCEPSSDTLVNPVTNVLLQKRRIVEELLDVRLILEPALANRAALHASAEQIARLEDILMRQQEKVRRDEPATEEDSLFHYTIALAAGNSVVMKVVRVLMDLLRETRERSLQVGARQQKSLAGHRRILAALKQGDAAGAEAGMRRHVLEIEKIVSQRF